MKATILLLVAIIFAVTSGCSFRSHANRHSTGASISTSSGGGVGGSIRY